MYHVVTILLVCQFSCLSIIAADDRYICIKDVGQMISGIMENYSQILHKHTDAVTALCWHPKHVAILASGGQDSTIYVWDVNTGQPIERMSDSEQELTRIKKVCWHPYEKLLVAASDEAMSVWSTELAIPVAQWLASNTIESIDLNTDGSHIAIGLDNSKVGLNDAEICILNLKYGKTVQRISQKATMSSSLAWHPDNKRLASGHADHYIRIWQALTSTLLYEWLGHSQQVTAIAWSPDGTRLASGSDDKTICIWDAQSGQKLHELSGHTGWIRTLSWHPDSRTLASGAGSDDKNVLIWDTLKGYVQTVLPGYLAGVRVLAWHKNGDLLATGSDDQTIRIWDWHRLKDLDIRKIISGRLKELNK